MQLLKAGNFLRSTLFGRLNRLDGMSRLTMARMTPQQTASYRTLPWKEPSIDELPIPEGSWDIAHKKMQAKYNRQLFLGGGFFVITVIVVFTSGIVQFNATIPKLDAEYLARGSNDCNPPPPKC